MKFIGIIPARYASSRFPGKPLADLGGKPMIQRVYERVSSVLDDVAVATDDIRIASAVEGLRRSGGNDFAGASQRYRPCAGSCRHSCHRCRCGY